MNKMNLVKYVGCDEFFQSRWISLLNAVEINGGLLNSLTLCVCYSYVIAHA